MDIIPAPQSYKCTGGTIEIPEYITFNIQEEHEIAVQTFQERLEASGFKIGFSASPFVEINEGLFAHNKIGAYKIEILKKHIKIFYADEQGAHNAFATLFLILMQAKQGHSNIMCAVIIDYPKFQYRGMHFDTARSFFCLAEIIKIIEQLSLLKYNYFHWHFADDQAWRIESVKYNRLTDKCGEEFYSQEQVKQIVSFALSRGVEIIPEFEIPGHSSAAIEAYPELSCKGEHISAPATGGIFKTILCAGKAESYKFIEDIINDLCELFPGKYMHLGGDEAPKSEWKACKHCRAKLKETGLASFEQLQAHMLSFAADILAKRNKESICWNDCLKADNLSENMIIQYWTQTTLINYSAKAQARKFIFSNLLPLYFDYPYSVNGLRSVYSFKPKLRFKRNLPEGLKLGAEGAVWCEKIKSNDTLEYMMFPRCIALSEAIWGTCGNYKDFIKRLNAHYKLLYGYNIKPAPISKAQRNAVYSAVANIKFFTLMLIEIIKRR